MVRRACFGEPVLCVKNCEPSPPAHRMSQRSRRVRLTGPETVYPK